MRASEEDVDAIVRFWRAANYVSTAIVHLEDNLLLRRPLRPEHFKEDIVGHWGTCPGINAIYAHLSGLVKRSACKVRLVVGTGHSGPAILASLFLEGALTKYYPQIARDEEGLTLLARQFGASYGFDTELAPEYPGVLAPAGELGGALAFAQGCALNDRGTITACVIGDGELETALAQAAWQGFRLLVPDQDGQVLPVVNANGWRMGSRSLSALTSYREQDSFFRAHGLLPYFVDADHRALANAFDEALLRLDALSQGRVDSSEPAWPVIVFSSPKGWTAPETVGNQQFAGTRHAHKSILRQLRNQPEHSSKLVEWLQSYRPDELFTESGEPYSSVISCLPKAGQRLGDSHSLSKAKMPLERRGVGNIDVAKPLRDATDAMSAIADLLQDVFARSESADLLLFSPDELASNRLAGLFQVTSLRYPRDLSRDDPPMGPTGQVIEILSEHLCYTWMHGHVAVGGRGLFVSYEAFAPLLDSLVAQTVKFIDRSSVIGWRAPHASLNILLTSLGWHNCPTHQNPGFIETLLGRSNPRIRIYTPSTSLDAAAFLADMLDSKNRINVLVAGKHPLPHVAATQTQSSATPQAWRFLCEQEEDGIALVAIGDCMAEECLSACDLLRAQGISYPISIIAINELTLLERREDPQFGSLRRALMARCGAVWAYIGYPRAIRALLWDCHWTEIRPIILGYRDLGRTATARERLAENEVGRNDIARAAMELIKMKKVKS